MLSRAADAVYWMSRYVERAENIARFIHVNAHSNLDLSLHMSEQWAPLVKVTGDYSLFEKLYGQPTQENVLEFLAFDARYPHSIVSCLRRARDNARSVRQIISSDMWQQINTFYLMVRDVDKSAALEVPHDFFSRIQTASQGFTGVTAATMSHGEAWHFAQMGMLIERADKTSRILDVKYFILLPATQDVGSPVDTIQWAALLQSASAFEMYRKRFGTISPTNVADFLLLDRQFPRSIHYCLVETEKSLHAITGSPENSFGNLAEQCIGRLRGSLVYSDIGEVISQGLHELLNDLQIQLNAVDDAISRTFFNLIPETDAF